MTTIYDCRARRHKVLAGDGICVLCGRRGVTDARHLQPALQVDTATPAPTAEPSPFDCATGRHKVLAGDGICVLCGAQNVADARTIGATA
ncbi:hypothetical protein [Microbacterium sp.]|uniref:hypothetical protein n=1 Tax=Microbacterium sp. TaxID=51671 RepID=UPI0039E22C80